MTAALTLLKPTLEETNRFVIPVRYSARGEILQTTTTAISEAAVHVRTPRPPAPGMFVGLQLYFPGSVLHRAAMVSYVTAGVNSGFWAEFSEEEGGRERIRSLLLRHRDNGDRGCQRFHTQLAASIRKPGERPLPAEVTNISRSGAFLRLDTLPALGSVVDLDVALPGDESREHVHAYVVHIAPRRGVGIQFIGASDIFRTRLDEYLSTLENPTRKSFAQR